MPKLLDGMYGCWRGARASARKTLTGYLARRPGTLSNIQQLASGSAI